MADHLLEAASLLVLLALCGWCALLFARRAPGATGLAFAAYTLALSLELAGHMLGGQAPESAWVWVNHYAVLACGPLYLEAVTRFPLPRRDLRWLVWAAYGVAGAVAVLGPMGLLGGPFDPMHPLAIAARQEHYNGGGHSIYTMTGVLIFLVMQLIGLVVLLGVRRRVRQGADPRVWRQALIFMLGSMLGWVPAVPFLPNLIPPEFELVLHGPPAIFFAIGPMSGVAALIHPDFYDNRGLFRRALIGFGMMTGAYLLYIAQIRPLTQVLDLVRPGFGHEPAIFGAAIVVALLVRPIQAWVTDRVDRLFFPHLLGFHTLLQETSQALATTIIPRDVARLAAVTLPDRLGASGAALLVLNQMGDSLSPLTDEPPVISPEHPLWRIAHQADGPTMLPEADYCGLALPALMLPLRVGGRLVGIYLLGARSSGINYTRDELGQIKVLGHHLAVAVENGRALRKIDELSQRALSEVEERNRIAREIHDTLAQGLTAASLQLEVVEATLTENPARAAKATNRAQSIVRAHLEEARRSVLELRAPLLGTESFPAALSQLLKEAANDLGAKGNFLLEGTYQGLSARIENQLYRIAQEALHNAVKYSSASHLNVRLRVGAGEVRLIITDDGVGFDPERTAPGSQRGGFGLTGMGERARLLEGALRLESEPGEGTRVEAIVPLRNREGEAS